MRRQLRAEDGIALPLVLVVMIVMTVMVFSALQFTSANARNANLSFSEQDVRGIAEGGFNRAASLLKQSPDPASGTMPGCPLATTAAWTAVDGGEVRWCATFSENDPAEEDDDTWDVTSEARVANPTAGGANLRHTVSGRLRLDRTTVTTTTTTTETVFDAGPWNFLFSAPSGCATVKNQAVIRNPLYIRGRLCFDNDAVFRSSPMYVKSQVKGTTSPVGATPACSADYTENCSNGDGDNIPGTISFPGDQAHVGVPANHKWKNGASHCAAPCADYQQYLVPDIRVEIGCSWLGSAAAIGNCVAAKNVHAASYPVRQDPPNYEMPKINWAARYTEASPGVSGRNHRCYAGSKADLEALNSEIGAGWSTTFGGTYDGATTSGRTYGGATWAGASPVLDTNTTRGTGGSTSLGPINFFPSQPYDCVMKKADGSVLGRLKWTPSTRTLFVDGFVFLDGYANIIGSTTPATTAVKVRGLGTVYLSGALMLDRVRICGLELASDGWCKPGCSPSQVAASVPPSYPDCWNPNGRNPGAVPYDQELEVNMLYLAAYGTGKSSDAGITMQNGADYQGGLFTQGMFTFKSSSPASRQYGPLLTKDLVIENNGLIAGFPALTTLAPGLPGGSTTTISVPVTTTTSQITNVLLVPGTWRG